MVDQKIINFISALGIDPHGAKIYSALVGKPAQTAQEITKLTGIPKTTIYRRLEELGKNGLIEEQIDEYKKTYLASPTETLNLLITQKEQEIHSLRAQLPEISHLLSASVQNSDPETKVLFYRGQDGIQQMNWNVLKTKDLFRGYTFRAWEEIVGKKFVASFLEEFKLLHFSGRELYSKTYLESRTSYKETEKWPRWETRFLDPKIINIIHQMDIYNNVVAIYNWHEGEVFGVEIYNQKVAEMQKQIFEVLWKLGKAKN